MPPDLNKQKVSPMKIFIIFLTCSLIIPQLAHACQPCAESLDWIETARSADVIVVGRKFHAGPAEGHGGPDWIDLKVDDELIGTAISEVVRVNSWDGMCPFGITIANGDPHIVFLTKANLSRTGAHYTAVSQGCGAKALPIVDDHVVLNSTRVPVTQFLEQLRQVVE